MSKNFKSIKTKINPKRLKLAAKQNRNTEFGIITYIEKITKDATNSNYGVMSRVLIDYNNLFQSIINDVLSINKNLKVTVDSKYKDFKIRYDEHLNSYVDDQTYNSLSIEFLNYIIPPTVNKIERKKFIIFSLLQLRLNYCHTCDDSLLCFMCESCSSCLYCNSSKECYGCYQLVGAYGCLNCDTVGTDEHINNLSVDEY